MGIKNINKILKKYCTEKSIKKIKLSDLSNKIVGIDLFNYLYKFLYSGNYLALFIHQIFTFWKNNIVKLLQDGV